MPLPAIYLRVEMVHNVISIIECLLVVRTSNTVVGQTIVRTRLAWVDEDVLGPAHLKCNMPRLVHGIEIQMFSQIVVHT